jgi:hypothetical protein
VRLETGLGSENFTWYQSWLEKKNINISAIKVRDFSEKRRYFTWQIFLLDLNFS